MKFWKSKIVLITIVIIIVNCQLSIINCFSQNVGINITGAAPNSSSLLDVDANNKGILIPRLPLTATNVGAPISPAPGAGEKGLMVYNTATAGISPNDVVPGFYYWTGSVWSPLGGSGSSGAGGWTDDGTVVRLTTSTDYVGIGTASPASTSALDITSTTKGILIPRMTTAQRDAITTPATGLQIYNTDCSTLDYWTGTCWISTRKSLPDPDPITSTPATTTFCAGQNRTYSVPTITGATKYGWTVPAGTTINSGQLTNTITVTFGNISGSVCVKASNACETSNQTCLAVNVDPIPNTPGNITGITSINPGQQSVTYFVASVNGASTYTWSVPAGATIASGTGTTTIVVNFACNASSGNISVTANSTCGSSPASALALTITPLLSASAGSAVFGGTSQTIGGSPTATGGTTAYTYSWSTSANLSSSTIANPIAYCTGSTTTYVVTVTDSRSCTATSSVVVTRDLTATVASNFSGPGSVGGSPTATGGAGGYSYVWTNPSELSSSTVANPSAKACITTTFNVTVTDANGCTASSTGVTVTKNLAASAGANQTMVSGCTKTIGGSPTATGGAGSYTYSWAGANLSSTTIANPVSSATSTTTYTVTVTDGNGCTASSSMTLTVGGTAVTFNNTSTGPSGSIQSWTVPGGVTCITIEAYGAQGGGNIGGLGARMKGTFTVTPGQVLKILVGQMGITGSSRGGGGGGTFVTDNSNNPLCIAGGGGGSDNGCGNPGGMPGVTSAGGTSYGSTMSGGGGTNGGGGGGGSQGAGGGGGGLVGNGGSGNACSYCGSGGAGGNAANGSNATQCGGCYPPGGLSFTNGGTGGSSTVNGGFGGGGSAYAWNCGGGGGGGYSGGGGGGYQSVQEPGGGGGSYNSGTNPSNTSGAKSGQGQVVITY